MSLTWDKTPSVGVTDVSNGFKIYNGPSHIGTAASTATSWSTTSANTTYNFKVTATNLGGESLQSAAPNTVSTGSPKSSSNDERTASATTQAAAPAAPTGVSASANSSSQITVSWGAVTGATSYIIYRGGTQVGTSTGTSYVNTGLSASTTYSYTVAAVNAGGTSAQSSAASATTQAAAIPVPAAPTGVSASAYSSSQITVSWSSVTGATSYKIYRSTSSSGTYSEVATGQTGTSYDNTGLSASTTYYYKVAAVNASGTSAQSSAASATTQPAQPAAPTGVKAEPCGSTQITVSWNAVAGVTGYKVTRSGNSAGSTSNTYYADTGLKSKTTYSYSVTAYIKVGNLDINGAQSSVVSATTP